MNFLVMIFFSSLKEADLKSSSKVQLAANYFDIFDNKFLTH
jgi:hypothetical protein